MTLFDKLRRRKRESQAIVPGLDQHSYLEDANRPAIEDRLKHDAQNATILLRQMYEFDIMIWAQQDVTDDEDRRAIADMKHRANARLAEVRMIVEGWDGMPKNNCTREEKDLMDSVKKAVQEAGGQRYPDKRKR